MKTAAKIIGLLLSVGGLLLFLPSGPFWFLFSGTGGDNSSGSPDYVSLVSVSALILTLSVIALGCFTSLLGLDDSAEKSEE